MFVQMFMAFTHMVLRAKKQSQNRAEREREREKDTVNINAQRDRDRRKRGKKCCWDPNADRRRETISVVFETEWFTAQQAPGQSAQTVGSECKCFRGYMS